MPKRKGKSFVFDDGEDENREDSVTDDDEGNEDLSLKILEKASSRRDTGNNVDSGVVSTVIVNGGTSKIKSSESCKKMKKRKKLEAAHEIPIVRKDQDEVNMVEGIVKDEEVETFAEPTPSNLVMNKLLRGARYFDPPDAGWVSCYSCGEKGHITINCPSPIKRRKPCFICGSLEHGAKQCLKGHDCYICKKAGHRAKDCPNKYKSRSKDVCLRCGDFGHDMVLCKYEYSQEDLKDIQCYVCKSFGHLCCIEPGDSLSWAVSCYRCGQRGHTGLACGRHYDESNENDYVKPSYFKCEEEEHFKRDASYSSRVRFQENSREASERFGCGEEGHFSRECSTSSRIISTSQGRDSQRLCYKCKRRGHFACECPKSSQYQDKLDTYLTRNSNLMQSIDQLVNDFI
ncbi:hypothetical protein CARUB_v10017389mg [Capsella rubella]|uniref:CCHC-type domain-containing protein n=1 Tax=Capsella rubella TaxID=81985 RepID=R0HGA9_9BRAS|nr:DNA-binding protein HEXBP [Capsella rubella]EOA24155.1 hypothetical protein CARUB_v10017389mg [Capsella rubella]